MLDIVEYQLLINIDKAYEIAINMTMSKILSFKRLYEWLME